MQLIDYQVDLLANIYNPLANRLTSWLIIYN